MRSAEEWRNKAIFDRKIGWRQGFTAYVAEIQRDALATAVEVILQDATPDSDRIPSIARKVIALLPPPSAPKSQPQAGETP